jgi:nucleoside transporter
MKARFAVMMFFQYAIWGAWAPVLWPHLTDTLGMSQAMAGWIFSALWLACMLAPFTGGQLADRFVPTQRFLGVAHLAGGAILLVLGRRTATGPSAFPTWMALMGAYTLFYAPTLALTNSIAFHHLPRDDFGRIRVWGTIGWIASGLALSASRAGYFPSVAGCDSLLLAGGLSLAMGLYCLTLPHTPPARGKEDPLAFRRAFVLLRDKNTLAFLAIAFVVTTELQFYYGPTASFLEGTIKISHAAIPMTMAVAQGAEIVAMAFVLPIALRRLGLRKTLALGVIAWPLRYLVFALAPLGPLSVMRPTVVASLTLHGIGFTFFFVASQIFIDRVAPADIRASAQSLLTLVTLGFGNFLGTLLTAFVMERFTDGATIHWGPIFAIPCALTFLCACAYLLWVDEPSTSEPGNPELRLVR